MSATVNSGCARLYRQKDCRGSSFQLRSGMRSECLRDFGSCRAVDGWPTKDWNDWKPGSRMLSIGPCVVEWRDLVSKLREDTDRNIHSAVSSAKQELVRTRDEKLAHLRSYTNTAVNGFTNDLQGVKNEQRSLRSRLDGNAREISSVNSSLSHVKSILLNANILSLDGRELRANDIRKWIELEVDRALKQTETALEAMSAQTKTIEQKLVAEMARMAQEQRRLHQEVTHLKQLVGEGDAPMAPR